MCETSSVERSLEEIVAFAATTYIQRCGRQLLHAEVLECMRVLHNVQGRYAVTMKKKREQSWDIYHESCHECSVVFATRGHNIQYSDWEEKILRRSVHRVELTFM